MRGQLADQLRQMRKRASETVKLVTMRESSAFLVEQSRKLEENL
jgi:hypothetical protein